DYQFTDDESVHGCMKDRSDYEEGKIRAGLHSMHFTRKDLNNRVRDLSGGVAIRLVLCQLFLGRFNILILDETTNFLNVFSIEALEQLLEGYEGTVLLVSHDKTLIERVADYVYVLEDFKVKFKSK